MQEMADSGTFENFYPRPPHGGRLPASIFRDQFQISTHALTWRATHTLVLDIQQQHISTHALTWRATGKAGD